MDIELRLLRSFVEIYEKGSLSRTAEKLCCTKAAMSMRLKLLETEIGETLFKRHHHKLEPTFKGTEFYARALIVLAAYDEMISATRSRVTRQKIKIGVPDDYALGILPNALARISEEPWQADIEIICDLSANLVTSLHRQEIDLAVVTLAAQPSGALVSARVGLGWVFHPDMSPKLGEPISIAAYPEGCVFRRAMISALEAVHKPWLVAAQSRNHAGIIAAVRGQLAVTSMAFGTTPAGLTMSVETECLPSLGTVPIYLLGAGTSRSRKLMQIEAAIEAEISLLEININKEKVENSNFSR